MARALIIGGKVRTERQAFRWRGADDRYAHGDLLATCRQLTAAEIATCQLVLRVRGMDGNSPLLCMPAVIGRLRRIPYYRTPFASIEHSAQTWMAIHIKAGEWTHRHAQLDRWLTEALEAAQRRATKCNQLIILECLP